MRLHYASSSKSNQPVFSYRMSDDGNELYVSMMEGDDSASSDAEHQSGMDALLNLAEASASPRHGATHSLSATLSEADELRQQVLKFSNELISMTARVSALSSEKLKIEFENREMKARTVPVQIELRAVREENTFLKTQLQDFWAEVEKVSKEKNMIYKERCEVVRKLTDETAQVKSELDAVVGRTEVVEAERERYRQQVQVLRSEMTAQAESAAVEAAALKEKIAKQENLISVLEQQGAVSAQIQASLANSERELANKNLELIEARGQVDGLSAEVDQLKTEKEQLLQKLVHNKNNVKAAAAADLVFGKGGWNLSDLVDAVSASKKEIGEKRKEIDSLHTVIEEMREKLPAVEANYLELQRCQSELEETTKFNEQLKAEFEKREDVLDQLRFERMKLETDHQSVKIRCGEFGKQIAALLHENESLRNKIGIHSGHGRSNPALAALPAMGDTTMVDRRESSGGAVQGVAHFRTVLDLVEQNSELKEKIDKLLNECETEAQEELSKLRSQYSKIQETNSELLAKRDGDRADYDRVISRLETELRKSQSEMDRLRKCIVGDADAAMTDDVEGNMVVAVLKDQLRQSKAEFGKHLNSVKSELENARAVAARTAAEMDRVREDLKREMEEKHYYSQGFEKLKVESTQSLEKQRAVMTRLNTAEVERDSLVVKVDELRSQMMLNDKSKRELESQISNLRATVSAMETAYKELSAEKEGQSAVLIGYHSRLENEAALYQTNSEALQRLYQEESEKNRETLNFYQSAYEEQVKRGNELSTSVARLSEDLAEIRDERNKIVKELQDTKLRLKLKDESTVAAAPATRSSTSSFQRDIARLESIAKAAEDDAEKWRDLAKVNETLVDKFRSEIVPQLEARISELESAREDVVMETPPVPLAEEQPVYAAPSSAVNEELESRIAFVETQLADKESEISILDQKFREECIRHGEDVQKLDGALRRVSELQEELHRDRLMVAGKEAGLADQTSELRSKLEIAEKEKSAIEHRLQVLRTENEKYLCYFASDLAASEKEERGRLVVEQLQSSMAVHTAREGQLVSDLQRARATNDVVLRENQTLKATVQDRDSLLSQLAATNDRVRAMQTQLIELETVRSERDRLIVDVRVATEAATAAAAEKRDLLHVREQLTRVEADNARLRDELHATKAQADEYLRMHEELSLRLSSVASSETNQHELEKAAEANAKLANDYAMLEKAKSQLVQTVSKLREEATKKTGEITALTDKSVKLDTELKHVQAELAGREKDISRQEGLMRLKDKRIGELETQSASTSSHLATDSEVKELMHLVNEYRSALMAKERSPKHVAAPVSPTGVKRRKASFDQPVGDEPLAEETEPPASGKRHRASVYHDAQEPEDDDLELSPSPNE